MVAEHDEQVVGYMLYELHRYRLDLVTFAVHPSYQRQGVGTAMVDKVRSKLAPQRRHKITLHTWERNVDSQLFWRAMGFIATGCVRGFYKHLPDDDAIAMQFVASHKEAGQTC